LTLATRAAATEIAAFPGQPLRGTATAPGDKSISHRALILGTIAHGETAIDGLLESEDVRRTAAAMAAFGASLERRGEGRWRVIGNGGFATPSDVLDLGNSGTGARLILGAAAGYPLVASFTGDGSLRERPMLRALKPLGLMGARWLAREGGRLPLTLAGGALKGIDYALPEPSAQVKSAILLAGLNATGETWVRETTPTRDHTERMLSAFGAELEAGQDDKGHFVRLVGGQSLRGCAVAVPGDPSSAAFLVVAGLIVPGSELTVRNVLLNPTRTGLIETLLEMGAELTIGGRRDCGGEAVGDITVRHSALRGVEVPAARAPTMIDEYPILAVAAAFARGVTVMRGIGELRVKESDRIALMADGLTACGVTARAEREGLVVEGGMARGGATVHTLGDHRIAMSFLVLGLAAREAVRIDEAEMIATSFPGFTALMRGLGARIG
jgi:3-phosphoshikimate 1-carboxyvinyltransferase